MLHVFIHSMTGPTGDSLLAKGVELVDELHQRRHGRIELLSLFDVSGHPADRVVRLPAQRSFGRVERRLLRRSDPFSTDGFAPVVHESPDASEEAEAALDSGIGP